MNVATTAVEGGFVKRLSEVLIVMVDPAFILFPKPVIIKLSNAVEMSLLVCTAVGLKIHYKLGLPTELHGMMKADWPVS